MSVMNKVVFTTLSGGLPAADKTDFKLLSARRVSALISLLLKSPETGSMVSRPETDTIESVAMAQE